MAINNDDCIKRVIKAYLFFNGEAPTSEILKHIDRVGYGLTKGYTTTGLTQSMKKWARPGKSASWFTVEPFKKNHIIWWRLKK